MTEFEHTLKIVICGKNQESYVKRFSDIADAFQKNTQTGYWKGKPEPETHITLWFGGDGPLLCPHCVTDFLHDYLVYEKEDSIGIELDGKGKLLWDYSDIVALGDDIRDKQLERVT